ncbi:MAG: TIGR01841 family phasin [Pseudomonadota bacterium]
MATVPDLQKTVEKTAAAAGDAVTAAPKAVAAVVQAAPAAAAGAVERVANALPIATKPAVKRVPAKRTAAKPARKAPVKTAARKPAVKVAARKTAVAKPTITKKIVNTVAATKSAAQSKGKTMTDTVKTVTQKGEAIIADLNTRAKDAAAKGQQFVGELNDFNKGNLEAIVESGKIAAKGFEKLGQDAAEYTRKSFEQTTTAFKGMAAVKSPTDLVKLHNDYVRSAFDAMVAQTSHSTEAMLKLVGEIAQPLSNRFAVAAQKVKLAA